MERNSPTPRTVRLQEKFRCWPSRRVIAGIELAQKIHKRQFETPVRFGSSPVAIAYSFFVEHYVSGLTGSVKG